MKKIEKYLINICFVICILVFAPFDWDFSREHQEGAPFLGNEIWAPCTFRTQELWQKLFQKSRINICLVFCILVFAPSVYIELPLGSSRRELNFLAMGYWMLTYSGAMIQNFRSLWSIFALSFAFYYLLPRYILSSLWGAPRGSSIFGH